MFWLKICRRQKKIVGNGWGHAEGPGAPRGAWDIEKKKKNPTSAYAPSVITICLAAFPILFPNPFRHAQSISQLLGKKY